VGVEQVGFVREMVATMRGLGVADSTHGQLVSLKAGKLALTVLNQEDLAEAACRAAWLAHDNAQPETRALGLDASEPAPAAPWGCRHFAEQTD
jgi:hypothetical protein